MINILLSIQSVPHKIVLDSAKTIIETRVVVDTLHLPANPTFEMMSQMKSFYQDSWNNLLWVVGGLFAVLGVALPFYVQYQAKKRFAAELNETEQNFKREIETLKLELTHQIKDEFNSELTIIKKELQVNLDFLSSKVGSYLQYSTANISILSKKYPEAIVLFFDSLFHSMNMNVPIRIFTSIDALLQVISYCKKVDLDEEIDTTEWRTFDNLLKRITDLPNANNYIERLIAIKKEYEKLV